MNYQIFTAINNFAGKSHFLDIVGIFFADKFLYIFVLIIVWLWFQKNLRNYVYLALGTAVLSRLVIAEVIKRVVNHPRPYEILNVHQLLADNERGMSFPSGHTVIFFSFAFAFYGTKYFWPFLILAAIGSFARIFVGIHFPADILGGILIALLVVWGFKELFYKSFKKIN